jgi:hypothetical protein
LIVVTKPKLFVDYGARLFTLPDAIEVGALGTGEGITANCALYTLTSAHEAVLMLAQRTLRNFGHAPE